MANSTQSAAASRPVLRWTRIFQRFARIQSAGGIVLLAATIAALLWANSSFSHSYESLLDLPVTIGFGKYIVADTLHLWINDGLMSLFFLLVGLEIKREMLIGELSSFKKAALPICGAMGGVILPAAIYYILNRHLDTAHGWGVPMATDIAFLLGILAVLGSKVPIGLKVFLTALSIVDDIAAVIVIAFFYSATIHLHYLFAALFFLALAILANYTGVTSISIYIGIGVIVWYCMLQSGVHATITGFLIALIIPARRYLSIEEFTERTRKELDVLESINDSENITSSKVSKHNALDHLNVTLQLVESPLARLEHGLQPWVSFCIVPLFALTNAGVHLKGFASSDVFHPLVLGIVLGLFIGKPIGITLFSWLTVKLHIGSLPEDMTWRHLHAASWLCGIGFTMSIFIAAQAFDTPRETTLAKISILAGSAAAACVGVLFMQQSIRSTKTEPSTQPD
ncbi:MAG TPA: Na+/H+ antiporter NhaA [Acidobacteriaceae bacterium]|nr:Na+/H+ antiporter NhaA [Acidobacteriaceae bacterium]